MDLILKIKDATMTGLESSLKFKDQVERRGKLKFSGGVLGWGCGETFIGSSFGWPQG